MELQVCSAVNNIIEDKTGQSVATCWGSQKKKTALAKEIVRRWNAFEEDYRVDLVVNAEKVKQQRDDLLEVLNKYGYHRDDCNLCSLIPCVKKNGKKVGCTCGFEAAIAKCEA